MRRDHYWRAYQYLKTKKKFNVEWIIGRMLHKTASINKTHGPRYTGPCSINWASRAAGHVSTLSIFSKKFLYDVIEIKEYFL